MMCPEVVGRRVVTGAVVAARLPGDTPWIRIARIDKGLVGILVVQAGLDVGQRAGRGCGM